MSSGNNETIVIDNIYVVRFRMLYAFYEDYFYKKHNNDDMEILASMQHELDLSSLFLQRNLDYLLASGYLGDRGDVVTISYKGIKFIENITDGVFDYSYESINVNRDHIITMFQRGDTLG